MKIRSYAVVGLALVALSACASSDDPAEDNSADTSDDDADDDTSDEPSNGSDAGSDDEPADDDDGEVSGNETGDDDDTDPGPDGLGEDDDTDDEPADDDTMAPPADDTADDEPIELPESAFLWLFASSPAGSMVNVKNPENKLSSFALSFEPNSRVAPWSPNGRWAVDTQGTTVNIYDLTAAGDLGGAIFFDNPVQVLRWVDNDSLVVSETIVEGEGAETTTLSNLVLAHRDGTKEELVAPSEQATVAAHSVSPDAATFIYSRAGTSFPVYSVNLQGPAGATELGNFVTPLLSSVWSEDSNWLSFGVSGPPTDSGVFLWEVGGGDPVLVSPEGAGPTPLHGFSPDGTKFAALVTGMEGSSVLVMPTDGSEEPTLLAGEVRPTGFWSPTGEYLYYSSDTGWLLPVGDDGSLGEAIEIAGWTSQCDLQWVTDDAFLFEACGESGDNSLHAAVLEDGALSITEVADADATNLSLSDSCLAVWGASTLQIGHISAEPSLTTLDASPVPISAVIVAEDGAGVAWLSEQTNIYWQELEDCAPEGDPVLVESREMQIQQIAFVPQPDLAAQ